MASAQAIASLGLKQHNSWLSICVAFGSTTASQSLDLSLAALLFSFVGPLVWFTQAFVAPFIVQSFMVGMDFVIDAPLPVLLAKQMLVQIILLFSSYLLIFKLLPRPQSRNDLRVFIISYNYLYLLQSILLPTGLFLASRAGPGFISTAIMAILSIAFLTCQWRQVKYSLKTDNPTTWRNFIWINAVQIGLSILLSLSFSSNS